MSDDEKLASPSFEEMDAGAVFGSDAVSYDATQWWRHRCSTRRL